MVSQSKLISLSSIIIYFLPLAILTGPFIPDLFISIVALIFIFLTIRNRNFFYFKNQFFCAFILFYFYILLRSILSEAPYLSLESSLFYFRFIFFSLAIWFLANNNSNFIKYFSYAFLTTILLALFEGFLQYLFDLSIIGLPSQGYRLHLTLNDKLLLGNYLARLFPLLFAFVIYLFSNQKYFVYLSFIMLILTDVLIYLSGERTAFGLLTVSTVFIIIFISKYKKIRFVTFIISLIIIAIITLVNSDVKKRNIDHTINQLSGDLIVDESSEHKEALDKSIEDVGIIIFSNEHHGFFITALNIFKDNPIFGIGPKLFRLKCHDEKYSLSNSSCNTHPHNNLIQLLAETGVVGFLFYILIVIKILYNLFIHTISVLRKNKYIYNDYQVCLLACFAISLWPFFPTLSLFNNWINIIYFLPIGFYLHSIYGNGSSTN